MQKKYKVYTNSLAEDDILNVFNFIAEDSFEMATIFKAKIYEQIASLEMFPEKYPVISGVESKVPEYRHLIFQDYRIIYKISKNTVIIVRLVNQRQLLNFD